ncbi:MAG TPA: lipopolysaccharide biosynthesis protein [Candidatus Edwardsbacteria bacterium]|nr:lipopolysaccharide biosynthesis protein [Candidatus Edwardsbacteria bacterium]
MKTLKTLASRWLPPGGFTRSVSILVGGTGVGQLLLIASSPLLTRLYTPEAFGQFQVYFSLMMFVALTATWKYELAVLLPDSDETAARLLAGIMAIVLGMSVVFAGAMWWFKGSGLLPAQYQPLRPYWWLLPFSYCGAGLYLALSYWALRRKDYSLVATTKVTQSASLVLTQLAGGLLRIGVLGLLAGDTIGRINGTIRLLLSAWRQARQYIAGMTVRGVWDALARYRRFPQLSLGASLINTAGSSLPPLMMAQWFGPGVLGWFALVDRVMGMPAAVIGQAASQVFMSEAAPLVTADPRRLQALFLKTVRKLALLGLGPCLVVVAVAPLLFSWIFGQSWHEAGIYARILVAMHYVAFVAWPLTPTLNLLEHQHWQLAWDILRLAATAAALLLCHHWGCSARVGMAAYGVAMTAAYLAHLLLSAFAIQKLCRAPAPGVAA